MVVGYFETDGRRQFVVCIKRRRVTSGTALTLENLLPLFRHPVKLVRVGWSFEGINVESKRIELFIAITTLSGRIRQSVEVSRRRDKSAKARNIAAALIQCRVTHEVRNRALNQQTSMVQVLSILNTYQIRDLGRRQRTSTLPCDDPGGNCSVILKNIFDRHLIQTGLRVRLNPRSAKECTFKGTRSF